MSAADGAARTKKRTEQKEGYIPQSRQSEPRNIAFIFTSFFGLRYNFGSPVTGILLILRSESVFEVGVLAVVIKVTALVVEVGNENLCVTDLDIDVAGVVQ